MKIEPIHVAVLVALALVVAGGNCGHNGASSGSDEEGSKTETSSEEGKKSEENGSKAKEGGTMRADVERVENPGVGRDDLETFVAGNNGFGMDLYGELGGGDEPGNLVFAPYNLSQVLAMAWAGAKGETRKSIGKALRVELEDETFHGAFNTVDQSIQTDSSEEADGPTEDEASDEPVQVVRTATGLWAQAGFSLKPPFLETLGRHYGAGVRTVDFKRARDQARYDINEWAAQETEDKIQDLVSEGALSERTRLVLTTAIYFKGQWAETFDEEHTEEGTFQNAGGGTSKVPMMAKQVKQGFRYTEAENLKAIELPYATGAYSMVLLVPDEGKFVDVQSSLDRKKLTSTIESLKGRAVKLKMPKFEFRTGFSAKSALSNLGMGRAFSDDAEFGGMTDEKPLQISDVFHKAFISVDEKGTEAAAASAAVAKATAGVMDPDWVSLTVDRPFMFAIRHRGTDSILFFGHVAEL